MPNESGNPAEFVVGMTWHWSFADPAEVEGEQAREAAFRRNASELFTRLRYLIAMIEGKRRDAGA